MYFLWCLMAMPVLGLFYTSYLAFIEENTRRANCPGPSGSISIDLAAIPTDASHSRRKVKWISRTEYEALLHSREDVIIIDLSMRRADASVEFPSDRTLSLSSDQVLGMLKWVPPESSVVLYGVSDACASMLWTKRDIPGNAPIFAMTEVPEPSEAIRSAAAQEVRHEASS